MLGNKIDSESARKVPTGAGQQIASSVGACFGEVSAKTGEGIEEVSKNKSIRLRVYINPISC